jgi:hypothetical protein
MTFADRFKMRCDQRWEDMSPRGDGRHCTHCDRTVIDLSKLTRKQAKPYLQPGNCVRAQLDERGEAMFRTEPQRGPLAGLALAAAMSVGCGSTPQTTARIEAPPIAEAMQTTDVPVGVAVEELDSQLIASFEAPAEEESERIKPVAAVRPQPAYPQHYPMIMGGI